MSTSTLPQPMSERIRSSAWNAIGTTIRIVVTDPSKVGAARAILTDDLAALDAACSRFRGDSELIRLEGSAGRPTMVSPLLAGAIRAALRGAQLTDGDLDPTLGQPCGGGGGETDHRQPGKHENRERGG